MTSPSIPASPPSSPSIALPTASACTATPSTKSLVFDTDHITLRVLVDRTSIEVFANDGQVSISNCFRSIYNEIRLATVARRDRDDCFPYRVFPRKCGLVTRTTQSHQSFPDPQPRPARTNPFHPSPPRRRPPRRLAQTPTRPPEIRPHRLGRKPLRRPHPRLRLARRRRRILGKRPILRPRSHRSRLHPRRPRPQIPRTKMDRLGSLQPARRRLLRPQIQRRLVAAHGRPLLSPRLLRSHERPARPPLPHQVFPLPTRTASQAPSPRLGPRPRRRQHRRRPLDLQPHRRPLPPRPRQTPLQTSLPLAIHLLRQPLLFLRRRLPTPPHRQRQPGIKIRARLLRIHPRRRRPQRPLRRSK